MKKSLSDRLLAPLFFLIKKWRFFVGLPLGLISLVLVWIVVIRATSGGRELALSGQSDFSENWNETVRIGCYNIAHGRGNDPGGSNWEGGTKADREARLDQIAALIREQNLDLIVLNEVDFNCTWSHGGNQATALAEKCGFPFFSQQRNLDLGIPFLRVAIGNAILSHFPIETIGTVDFPPVNDWEPIVAGKKKGMKAVINFPDGTELEVFGIHAETRDQEVRKKSIEAVIQVAGDRSVIAGDFN